MGILPICPQEAEWSEHHLVKWRRFALEQKNSKIGTIFKKLTMAHKSTPFDGFIVYMKPKLQHFVRHNFVAWWRDEQSKDCLRSFPKDIVVLVVDFAENYSFKVHNEVQSMHWHTFQILTLAYIPN